MSTDIRVRTYLPGDVTEADSLWARVGPYRPGDEAEIEAMYDRARHAKEAGDKWIPHGEESEHAPSNGWVAVLASDANADRVVGFVEVVGDGAVDQMPQDTLLAKEWRRCSDVAQMTRLSVEPECWRHGVGTQLTQTAIGWCREHGYRTLVLNTTAAQAPALSLYLKLGFREAARTFLDKWELVWLELTP